MVLLVVPAFMSLVLVPDYALAQAAEVSATDACFQGKSDAQRNTSGIWFFAGCVGILGLLIAYTVAPTPPASSILGKSPEFVAAYTDCYRSEGKSAQGRKALIGCVVFSVIYVGIWAVVLLAADEVEDDIYYY